MRGGGGSCIALHTCVLAVCIVIAALTSYRSATTAVYCGHGICSGCGCVGYKVDDPPNQLSAFLQHLMCSGTCLCVSNVVVSGSSTYQCH